MYICSVFSNGFYFLTTGSNYWFFGKREGQISPDCSALTKDKAKAAHAQAFLRQTQI